MIRLIDERTAPTPPTNTAGKRQYQPELHGFIDPKAVAEAEADLEEMKVALTGSIRREVLISHCSGATWGSGPQYLPRAGSTAASAAGVGVGISSNNSSNIIGNPTSSNSTISGISPAISPISNGLGSAVTRGGGGGGGEEKRPPSFERNRNV